MLFNSYFFIFLFLPLALIGWFWLNRLGWMKIAQGYLIGMSLWFYAYFNVSFLWVMLGSCFFNYGLSFLLSHKCTDGSRRALLIVGCIGNIGALGIFKYYNFFVENLNALFSTDFHVKNILLPLGISFFTFQQLSFLIDRCKGKAPHYGILDYLSFVTFFPSLISGPIVLHASTVPQFREPSRRRFDAESFAKGVAQFTIGLGKKVLLADTLALAVNYGYDNLSLLDTPSALIVALSYTLELYFDFSGYSDMAIGIGRMFRIELPENFNSPYKAVSVKDFWRRWHMTLSSFLQTYVYIPLGGSRKGKARTFVNTIVTFLISGLWHGANWTFLFWGLLHGLGVAAAGIGRKQKKEKKGVLKKLCQLATFVYVCFAFVFFRADSIRDGFQLIGKIGAFQANGQIYSVAAAMEPSEIYLVTKALSLAAPSLVAPVQLLALFCVVAICLWILGRRNTAQILADGSLFAGKQTISKGCGEEGIKGNAKGNFFACLVLSFLFAWSVISLSGVSTFVYFNF